MDGPVSGFKSSSGIIPALSDEMVFCDAANVRQGIVDQSNEQLLYSDEKFVSCQKATVSRISNLSKCGG
jgi:hypothetical protein